MTPEERSVTEAELDTLRRINVTLAVGSQDKGKRIEELEAELANETEAADALGRTCQELRAELNKANQSIGHWGGKWGGELLRRCEAEAERDALKAQLAEAKERADYSYERVLEQAVTAEARADAAEARIEQLKEHLAQAIRHAANKRAALGEGKEGETAIDMRPPAESAPRRSGRKKLVYDKAKRMIVAVPQGGTDAGETGEVLQDVDTHWVLATKMQRYKGALERIENAGIERGQESLAYIIAEAQTALGEGKEGGGE